MKKLLLIPIVALLALTGCKTSNPNVGPALLRLGVSSGAGYSLMRYPAAVPAVRASADIVCAVAAGTNVSPANIVAALDAYNFNTAESIFIINAALGAYELCFNGLSDTGDAKPYAEALCGGLQDALLLVPSKSFRSNEKWPQAKFKP